ncbi:unnamed protein product, partial [marine sediment metagenome]
FKIKTLIYASFITIVTFFLKLYYTQFIVVVEK